MAAAKPNAIFIAGILGSDTAAMVKQLRAALGPGVRIMATDGFSGFPLVRILLGTTAEGMLISEAGVPNSHLPAPGRMFLAAFGKAVDEAPGSYAAYAAQATEVLLDAIARSKGTRASVTSELEQPRLMQNAWRVRSWLPTAVIVFALAGLLSPVAARASQNRPGPSPVVVRVDRGGFAWADAGIGAVATLAVVLVAVGTRLTLRSARQPDGATETRGARQ